MSLPLHASQLAPDRSENELIAAVRRGEDRAFEALYSRYRSRISAYVFGMVGDHGRAEDITQEVFISALRRICATGRPISFKPWIYEIAKNACIDEFRRARRVQEVPLETDPDHGVKRRALVSCAPTPEAAVESKQRLQDLCGAFGVLSQAHHQVIVLRELEGLSYSQIAERMGTSRPVVESTLFRARRRLGEEYEELVSGRRCEQVQTILTGMQARPVRSLRIRERRQLARHLAHCQACRRHAQLTGFDESQLKTPSVAQKIAALLPIPWLRWRRSSTPDAAPSTPSSQPMLSLDSLRSAVAVADPTGPFVVGGSAAAAAAAVVIAAVGGGAVTAVRLPGGHASPSGGHSAAVQHPARSLAATGVGAGLLAGARASSGLADALGTGVLGQSPPGRSSPPPGSQGKNAAAGGSPTSIFSTAGAGVLSIVTGSLPGGPSSITGWGINAASRGTSGPASSPPSQAQPGTGSLPPAPPAQLPGPPKVALPPAPQVGSPSLPPVSVPPPPAVALPSLPKVGAPSVPALPNVPTR